MLFENSEHILNSISLYSFVLFSAANLLLSNVTIQSSFEKKKKIQIKIYGIKSCEHCFSFTAVVCPCFPYDYSNDEVLLFFERCDCSVLREIKFIADANKPHTYTHTHTRCAQISTDLKFDGIVKLPRL